ncbi:MAG: ribbon-helix-helix domain-containing protein [Hyphomonadaceae bacterium]|nr:ribbon-helix-helix domain-containing protein [Hyphomonadaceae bacterium]
MAKPRINIHIPTDLHALLYEEARRPGVTKTAIIEAALRAYFCPDSKLGLEERLLDRLDKFDIRQGAMERDIAVCLETICHYVLYWLTRMEPIPDGERDAAQSLGKKRFDHFLGQVARNLSAGGTLEKSNASLIRNTNGTSSLEGYPSE